MSYRLLAGIAAALMVSAAAHAQTSDRQTTRYQTPEGELTVHSGQPGPRTYAPPPPFAPWKVSSEKAFAPASAS